MRTSPLTGFLIALAISWSLTEAHALDPKKIPADKPAVAVTTLAQEREEIAAEIETEVLYDLAKAEAAKRSLREIPKEQSPARNTNDAMTAFAQVDERFAAAMELHKNKKFEEAAEAFQKLINPTSKTYFTAAAAWGRVSALQEIATAKAKPNIISDEEIAATDAAAAIGMDYPERLSFALRGHELAIKGYEKEARMFYAYKQYIGYLDAAERLGLSDAAETKRIQARVSQLSKDLKDPVGTVGRLMKESKDLLTQAETGQPTKQKQEEVVAWLDDLIKTVEERQQKNQPKPKPQQQARKTGDQQNQQKQGQQQQQGQPKGGKPSKPARGGYLTDGDGRRVGPLDPVHPSDRSDEWGKLPPAEREKFIQALKEKFPDRYEEILKEYFRELAEDRAPAATQPK